MRRTLTKALAALRRQRGGGPGPAPAVAATSNREEMAQLIRLELAIAQDPIMTAADAHALAELRNRNYGVTCWTAEEFWNGDATVIKVADDKAHEDLDDDDRFDIPNEW